MTFRTASSIRLQDGKSRNFAGKVKIQTAIKLGATCVSIYVYDNSGKGRGNEAHWYAPDFAASPSNGNQSYGRV